jgi:hypothetical protein
MIEHLAGKVNLSPGQLGKRRGKNRGRGLQNVLKQEVKFPDSLENGFVCLFH